MKATSLGFQIVAMEKAIQQYENIIGRIIDALQLLTPQKNFNDMINHIKSDYEKLVKSKKLDSKSAIDDFESFSTQIQSDIDKIKQDFQYYKSMKSPQASGDIYTIEKIKKLSNKFKEYNTKSMKEFIKVNECLQSIKKENIENKKFNENVKALVQNFTDEINVCKSSIPADKEKENILHAIKDIRIELEAHRKVLHIIHKNSPYFTQHSKRLSKNG